MSEARVAERESLETQQQTQPRGLLEELHLRVGCRYLSDLMLSEYLRVIQRSLAEIEAAWYDREEWLNAIRFITGREREFDTAAQARSYLLSCHTSDLAAGSASRRKATADHRAAAQLQPTE